MCERGINFFTWFASPSSLKTCMFFNILTSFERDIHIKNASILLHFMHSNLNDLQQNLFYKFQSFFYYHRNLLDIHSKS